MNYSLVCPYEGTPFSVVCEVIARSLCLHALWDKFSPFSRSGECKNVVFQVLLLLLFRLVTNICNAAFSFTHNIGKKYCE